VVNGALFFAGGGQISMIVNYRTHNRCTSGNIFFALFGAVALVGVLGAGVMTFMKGPLATSIKLTRQNTAETQMSMAGQVAVMAATSQANSGDCDADTFVEPLEWRDPAALPHPVNGGLIPMTIGVSKKDPWGTEYGYCVWDHGSMTNGGGTCGGVGQMRLAGTNANAYPVVALVSAGADKTFTTTCRDFATADANSDGDLLDAGDFELVSKAASTDDDIIFTYTYEEATGASGGLWTLKSGDSGTATIAKDVEVTGGASFGGMGQFQGGVLLPDSSLITCDATTAGVMARAGSAGIEICDGAGNWTEITGGSGGGVGLSLTNGTATPNVSSGMNVYGTCGNATCYSPSVTFTLTNSLGAASAVLATSLSNTASFEFVSDTCNGQSIAAGGTCTMVVRAKAGGNGAYAGTLNVTGHNSPMATLDGTASNFTGCNAGGVGPGGYYVGCNVSGSYNLIVTPSGCTGGMTNPTCAGGADTYTAQYSSLSGPTAASGCCSGTGLQNTTNLVAYSGGIYVFPAADYCSGLVYGGYDDWFLPSITELTTYLYPNRASVGLNAASYWSSTEDATGFSNNRADFLNSSGVLAGALPTAVYFVRCMRRDPAATLTPTPDTTPVITPTTGFATSYGTVAGAMRTSNAITVYGVAGPAPISISGAAGAQFSVNGAAYTSTATTVTNGQSVTLQVAAPNAGTESLVTLTIGTATYTWTVRTIYAGNTVRIFTTNASGFAGNLGVSGADAQCVSSANAAGLAGNWVAVMQGATTASVADRLPWNWTQLRNMGGALVATSLADFVDGSVSAPMNISETGVTVGGKVMTGLSASGNGFAASASNNCVGWASANGPNTSSVGDPAVTNAGQYFSAGLPPTCNSLGRLLCMETTGGSGTDDDPLPVSFTGQVVYASGGTGSSNTVTLSGVSGPVNISIVPSAGTVDILKNGVSVGGGTTTAYQNDTLSFKMTAPAVAGNKNTATITLGTDTYTWTVGYADPANTAIVFVSSTTTYTGNLGGLTGADSICQSNATAAGYSGTWKAIISDSTTSALSRIPFNWGTLKRPDGVVVANSWSDLWDGSIQNPISITAQGTASAGYRVHSNTTSAGEIDSTTLTCSNWSTTSGTAPNKIGTMTSTSSTWIADNNGHSNSDCPHGIYALYCMSSDPGTDTKPSVPNATGDFTYAIQVPTSTLTTSNAVTVAGLGSGVAATVTITGASGSPGFTVNGVAGTSGVTTVQNGDLLALTMTSAATASTSYSMTVTVGSGSAITWRVWTGDNGANLTKRVFVTSTTYNGSGVGSAVSADSKCNTRASAAALGGTWKAIISQDTESTSAVNRIGYNWSRLQLVDGTDVVLAGNIWKAGTIPLLSPIYKTEFGAVSSTYAYTGTGSNGLIATGSTCNGWTTSSNSVSGGTGNTGSSMGSWVSAGSPWPNCESSRPLYCIEQ
jgi:hypothetical protein